MRKFYYFYDLNEVLIDRYPAKISNKILEEDPSASFIFIYSENYKYSTPTKIPEGCKSFYIPLLSRRKLMEIVEMYPPKSLTTIASRIPDTWVICFFNNLGIPTNVVQHGLWSDKLQRIPLLFLIFDKFSKFSRYMFYVYQTARLSGISFFGLLNDFYYFLIKENKHIPELDYLDNDLLRAKRVFSFDDSWDEYYLKKYGYSKKCLSYIGNPDILLLRDLKIDEKENAVCYLCQSLVEDGRMSAGNYKDFLQLLSEEIPQSMKLYVKLHPRSKIEIYDSLNYLPNVEFTNNLPVCSHYIGHYTGLLSTVIHITDNILIWLFPNHHIPEYFKKFGSVVTDKRTEINFFLKSDFKQAANGHFKKLTSNDIKTSDPIAKIAEGLMNK